MLTGPTRTAGSSSKEGPGKRPPCLANLRHNGEAGLGQGWPPRRAQRPSEQSGTWASDTGSRAGSIGAGVGGLRGELVGHTDERPPPPRPAGLRGPGDTTSVRCSPASASLDPGAHDTCLRGSGVHVLRESSIGVSAGPPTPAAFREEPHGDGRPRAPVTEKSALAVSFNRGKARLMGDFSGPEASS